MFDFYNTILFFFSFFSHFLQTYIEPGTGRRFHSLVVVERYLTEANEEVPLKALMPTNKSSVCSFPISDQT